MNSQTTYPADSLWYKTKQTSAQIRIAKLLGINLMLGESFLVTSARIKDAVAEAIGEAVCRKPTKNQMELSSKITLDISSDSHRVAWAKIQERTQQLYYEANMAAIKEMQLAPGDIVIQTMVIEIPGIETTKICTEHTVSPIRWDGLVYFKGGNGACAWANKLTKPKNEDNAKS